MTIDSPDRLNQSNAAVLRSQPLTSSAASMLSRRYTACEPGPPLSNSTRTLRAIEGDGTSRYSTGARGLEKAPALADSPATPSKPGNTAAAIAATVIRHNQGPCIVATNTIGAPHLLGQSVPDQGKRNTMTHQQTQNPRTKSRTAPSKPKPG